MIEAGPFGSLTVTLSVKTESLHVLEFQHLNQMTWSFRGAMDGFGEGWRRDVKVTHRVEKWLGKYSITQIAFSSRKIINQINWTQTCSLKGWAVSSNGLFSFLLLRCWRGLRLSKNRDLPLLEPNIIPKANIIVHKYLNIKQNVSFCAPYTHRS